ncbi:hypothetical protein BDQ12DRAFT_603633 [Crucibulum laeve]|uniref:DUF4470 domain-containing protein n=1 Tax=Crucibulum laeve TaxID=68775 RepID=A0A5C3MED5_9AGAR|nr:hypothetical protein BDQ12DRAFT_603633 [Crucibulum laeve]
MASTDLLYFRAVLTRIKSQRSLISGHGREKRTSILALQPFTSHSLGSDPNGKPITQVPCSNVVGRGTGITACPNVGLLACSRPSWVVENRKPVFSERKVELSSSAPHRLWGDVPAYDCFEVNHNEGLDQSKSDFKLCFTAAEDIRNLVQTVNGLPKDYRGKCDILFNNMDSIVVNRNLLILYVLLTPGPSIEESAELATHLIYSAALTPSGAAYVRRCVQRLYGEGPRDGDMSFQSCLKTRGRGKITSVQTTAGIKRPREMFLSNYELPKAMKSFRGALLDHAREDDRQRMLTGFKPAHRVGLNRFWNVGILSPFGLYTGSFTEPNRLLFSAQGEWLGQGDHNPLHGWDVASVRDTGLKHDVNPADIMGCLFFHVKDELQEFTSRMKDFNVDIHFTQYDSRVLSKGISTGVLAVFEDEYFDRIDMSNMADYIGIGECLADWGPLLNRMNPHAALLMHSKYWHHDHPSATALYNPRILDVLKERCRTLPAIESQLQKIFAQGPQSPALYRLVESMDAFVDHEDSFLEYLEGQHTAVIADNLGLRLREVNHIHAKRLGVPLHAHDQKLPDLTKQEFYDQFTLGGADFPLRFIEFESFAQGWEWTGSNDDGLDAVRNYTNFLLLGLAD